MNTLRPLVPALLIGASLSAQNVTDTLVKTDGSRIRGVEVVSMKIDEITYQKGDVELTIPGSALARVEWHEPPDAFVKGLGFLDTGEYENAQQQFGAVVGSQARDVLQQEAEFLTAKAAVLDARRDPSGADTAIAAIQSFQDAHAGHFRIPEARMLLGTAQRLAGRTEEAVATFERVEEAAVNEGWGTIWNARARHAKAVAYLEGGQIGRARAAFQGTVSAVEGAAAGGGHAAELADLRTKATIGEGETYLAQEDYRGAVDYFRKLARAQQPSGGGDTTLFAAAKAGEGQALYEDAMANDKPDQLREAQVALALASVRDSSAGDPSARASYFLGKVLLALGPDRESADFKHRAEAYFDAVIQHWPDSTWAAKAAEAKN